jgi:2,4-dienoyl-CoA reductase-like NADH-dependent reductase (Old Yellow Enzyme family)
MSNQPLFMPYRMGDLDLPNRIVMAPLTRMRAQSHDHVPTALQAEYYAQRASAGLVIAEATAISPEGFGWADTPGLWTKEQVRGWRRVTDAVMRLVAASLHNSGIREQSRTQNYWMVRSPCPHRTSIQTRFRSRGREGSPQ